MLTFEIEDEHGQLRISADQDGLLLLRRNLEFLLAGETHVHLASPEWAGNEVDANATGQGSRIVHQVDIRRLTDD